MASPKKTDSVLTTDFINSQECSQSGVQAIINDPWFNFLSVQYRTGTWVAFNTQPDEYRFLCHDESTTHVYGFFVSCGNHLPRTHFSHIDSVNMKRQTPNAYCKHVRVRWSLNQNELVLNLTPTHGVHFLKKKFCKCKFKVIFGLSLSCYHNFLQWKTSYCSQWVRVCWA